MPLLKPFEVADLEVVKQRLLEYRPGEIAHIENVMAGEERNRFHRRLNRLETIREFETEVEEESKRDLESTERFELENEIRSEMKEELKIGAGLSVSANLGPVSSSAFFKMDYSKTQELTEKTAQKYSKELTERAMDRVREKTREFRRSVEMVETEENNEHRLKGEQNHTSGIYRWVDKYYLVKRFNYGKRLFYELVLPEPAVNYVFSKTWSSGNNEDLLIEPDEPKHPETSVLLMPSDVAEDNYLALAGEQGAEDVKPPPPIIVHATHSFSKEMDGTRDFVLEPEIVQLPEGYFARFAKLAYLVKGFKDHSFIEDDDQGDIGRARTGHEGPRLGRYVEGPLLPYAKLHVGSKTIVDWSLYHLGDEFDRTNGGDFILLDRETESLPITGAGHGVGAIAMNIRVICQRSPELFEQWQLTTYQKIWAAYKRRRSAYEEKIKASQVSGGVQISGNNPAMNLQTIRSELKNSFLRLWMLTDYEIEDGWHDGDLVQGRWPRMIPENVLYNEPAIQFGEEAFDWENMTFQFVSHYAGRKSQWLELSNYTDPDPLFENFLKAGAAIVRIPVVPRYTHAVLFYQLTENIPSRFMKDLPALSEYAGPQAARYNQFIEEVDPEKGDEDIFQEFELVPEDNETFEIKVPTRLIWLQPNSDLNPSS